MKIFRTLLMAIAVLALASCASQSYDKATCEALQTKIAAQEELSQDDYSNMMDQIVAIGKEVEKKQKEIGDDREKKLEYAKNEDTNKMLGYLIGFSYYIKMHEKDLDASNLKKLKECEEELNNLKL